MIDLTPLDLRRKAGDFSRALRGFEPQEVEAFLQLAADRLEELVRENLVLRERVQRLQHQVTALEDREVAAQAALAVAQQLRRDLEAQGRREAELMRQEAEVALSRRIAESRGEIEDARRALSELDAQRRRFLRGFRALLQRELESIEVEEARLPHEVTTLELVLGRSSTRSAEEVGRDGLPEPLADAHDAPSSAAVPRLPATLDGSVRAPGLQETGP